MGRKQEQTVCVVKYCPYDDWYVKLENKPLCRRHWHMYLDGLIDIEGELR
jgi:hypothetical protein